MERADTQALDVPGSRGHRRRGGGRERGRGAGRVPRGKPNIVWLEQGANNPYWDAQHKAAAEAGRRLGFTFKAVSGNNNPSDQASIMKQLVDQGVDVIMLNAIDPKAMAPALAYAKQKGVKVLNLYGVEPKATASVTFDEIRTGRVDAKYAAMLLKKRYGSLKGKVAVLMGILGQPASDLRAKGFVDYMKTERRRRRRRSSRPAGRPTRPPPRCRTGSSSTRTSRSCTRSRTPSRCRQ